MSLSLKTTHRRTKDEVLCVFQKFYQFVCTHSNKSTKNSLFILGESTRPMLLSSIIVIKVLSIKDHVLVLHN